MMMNRTRVQECHQQMETIKVQECHQQVGMIRVQVYRQQVTTKAQAATNQLIQTQPKKVWLTA